MKNNRSSIIILAIAFTVVTAGVAFSYGGSGMYGGHMMGQGYGGGHMRGPYMHDDDDWGNLSKADAAKIDAAQKRFFNETRELRQQIAEKQIALSSELEKDAPDKGKAGELQNQISRLQSDFDQKALNHRIEMHKIFPEGYAARGYGNGYCR